MIPLLNIAGQSLPLLDLEPDWTRPVKLTLDLAQDEAEALDGSRDRAAAHFLPRHTLSYRVILSGPEAQQLRALLGTAGMAERVAVPLWPDLRGSADWSARYFAARVNVGLPGYDHSEDGSQPTGDQVAPVLIGRLQRSQITWTTDETAEATLTITEDAPYSQRIEPNFTGSDLSGWQALDWPIDWTTAPTEDTVGHLTTEVIGDGRLLSVGGNATAPRRSFSGGLIIEGAALREFLRFWVDHQAHGESFEIDSPAQPGSHGSVAPHTNTRAPRAPPPPPHEVVARGCLRRPRRRPHGRPLRARKRR